MTKDKELEAQIHARMERRGENYFKARQKVVKLRKQIERWESRPLTREELANQLLDDCPADLQKDHAVLARMILDGLPAEEILHSPECERNPETYAWLKPDLV